MVEKNGSTGRRAGLTPRLIARKAKALTRTKGLEGWSMRDLSAQLQVVPSVIYHYFPNRDAIVRAVIDDISAEIVIPDENLEWKEWFFQLAKNARLVLLKYPGVTNRLMYGQFSATAIPAVELGYRKLSNAGFARCVPLAFSMIINTVLWAVTARNLRNAAQGEQRHDLSKMIADLQPVAERSPALQAMLADYLVPLSQPENEEEMSLKYFELSLKAILSGLENVVLTPAPAKSTGQNS